MSNTHHYSQQNDEALSSERARSDLIMAITTNSLDHLERLLKRDADYYRHGDLERALLQAVSR